MSETSTSIWHNSSSAWLPTTLYFKGVDVLQTMPVCIGHPVTANMPRLVVSLCPAFIYYSQLGLLPSMSWWQHAVR